MSILQKLSGGLFKSGPSSASPTTTELFYDTQNISTPPSLSNTLEVPVTAEVYPIDFKTIPNVINWPEQTINCIASINIPNGFKKSSDSTAYEIELSVDKHTIRTTETEEEHDVIVHIIDGEGKLTPIASKSTLTKISLKGEFYFNTMVSGFVPVTKLDVEPTLGETVLSGDGIICTETILGYMGDGKENTTNDSSIDVTTGIEFVINTKGEKIENDPFDTAKQKKFNDTLDGLGEYVLFQPFSIILTPNIEE